MPRLPDALAHCLDLIDRGETDVERCLEIYPELKEALRPLLILALAIRSLPEEPLPSPEYIERRRIKLMKAIEEQEDVTQRRGD